MKRIPSAAIRSRLAVSIAGLFSAVALVLPEDSDVPPPEIVYQNEKDIGFLGRPGSAASLAAPNNRIDIITVTNIEVIDMQCRHPLLRRRLMVVPRPFARVRS